MKTLVNEAFEGVRIFSEKLFGVGTRPTQITVNTADLIEGAWNAANAPTQIGVWVFLLMALGSPVLLLAASLTGMREAVVLAAIVLLIGWFVLIPLFILCLWQDPLLIPLLMTSRRGRAMLGKAVAAIGAILACEFGFGVYVSLVPVANDFLLLGVILLAVFTLIGSLLAGWKKLSGLMGLLLIVLTLLLCVGGTRKASGAAQSLPIVQILSGNTQGRDANTVPIAPGAVDIKITREKPSWTIPLYPNAWSGWISLPDHTDFRVKGPGKIVALTWDGQVYEASGNDKRWAGTLRSSNFRLMGEGEATVSIE